MKTRFFVAVLAALALLSPRSDAAGYYSLPHSKVQVARCIDEVKAHYGDDILRMEQHTTEAGTVVLFQVGRLERGEWIVTCDGDSGRIVKAQRIDGKALGTAAD
jgi:hypothetical protein